MSELTPPDLTLDQMERLQKYLTPILMNLLEPVINRLGKEFQQSITDSANSVRMEIKPIEQRLDRHDERLRVVEKDLAVVLAKVAIFATGLGVGGGAGAVAFNHFILKN